MSRVARFVRPVRLAVFGERRSIHFVAVRLYFPEIEESATTYYLNIHGLFAIGFKINVKWLSKLLDPYDYEPEIENNESEEGEEQLLQ
jgi:hypothetical protein